MTLAQLGAVENGRWLLLNLGVGLMSLLVLLGGLFGLYMLWYVRGRDAPVGQSVAPVTKPPSDLAPGLVGTVLDERADLKDIVATVLDLAARGVLRLSVEAADDGSAGARRRRDVVIERVAMDPSDGGGALASFERAVLRAVLGDAPRVRLSTLHGPFAGRRPVVEAAIYDATVAAGLFEVSPDESRRRYGLIGVLGLGVTLLMVCGALGFVAAVPAALLVPVALGAVSLGAVVLARYMPRKTPRGSAAAARWRAFRDRLERLIDGGPIPDAPTLRSWLPYAVALGCGQRWARLMAVAGAGAPDGIELPTEADAADGRPDAAPDDQLGWLLEALSLVLGAER